MLKMFCPESHQLLVTVLKPAVFGCFNTDTTLLLILAQGMTGNRDDIRLSEKCWDCALPIPTSMVRSPKKRSHVESRDWRPPFAPSGLETPTPRLGHCWSRLGLQAEPLLSPPNPNLATRKWLTTATSGIPRHPSPHLGSKSKLDVQRGAEPGDLEQREGGRSVYALLSMVTLSTRQVANQGLGMWPVN